MQNYKLGAEILKDMRAILSDTSRPLSERLSDLEWRSQLLNEIS